MAKDIIKDLCSDLLGGTGVSIMFTISMLEQLTEVVKLFGAIGGLVLVYVSIKYKIELIKEKKLETQKKKRITKK